MTAAEYRRMMNLQTHETQTHARVQSPKPKRHQAAALGQSGEGEEGGIQRTVVRFIGYRVRPLDPDNFAGGCKDLLDGLRHSGLISGDEPWKIDFQTQQVKVWHYFQEKTIIEVEL